jgi:hypothetical protein
MKILYITNHLQIIRQSGGFFNDYLNDLLFYGFTELEGIEIIDSTPIVHLYKENKEKIPIKNLWGKGFTSTFLIDKDTVDRNAIEEKIKDKYFDLIIYGAVKRCLDYYELVSSIYSSNKIILIDGDDFSGVHSLATKHPYFKRELLDNKMIPIHFAIPESKITQTKLDKTQDYGLIIPGRGGYIFNVEQEYYNDYNKSYFGVTMKKAGWDCMRHYEILANNCIPYFTDLEECPQYTLTNLPKDLLLYAKELANNFDEQKYFIILNELFEYTKSNLTTRNLAKYVLEKIL